MNLDESRRLGSIKDKLELRARVMAGIRAFFAEQDFLEVDTPLRVPAVAPEQFILPFTSEGWFLSTSPELQMKRLLAAGYRRIFQIARCFRQDERGSHHNPEFTMLEWYRAQADYNQIIVDSENLLVFLADRFGLGRQLTYQGQEIDLSPHWSRITAREAYIRYAGWDPFVDFDGKKFDDDMVDKIIPNFPRNRPMVIMDYPAQCAALARLKAGQVSVAERAEIFLAGLEIANIYSELTDPAEQLRRFKDEMEIIRKAGRPCTWPQKFMEAVPNMPPCGGVALGVDRLVMLFCDAATIDQVLAFPSDLL